MWASSSFLLTLSTGVLLSGTSAQDTAPSPAAATGGFWKNNCSKWSLGWEDETLYRRFMVAECPDSTGNMRTSFLGLNDCVANHEGVMVPAKGGYLAGSCAQCTTSGSLLTCQCDRTFGGPTTTTLDLDTVIMNVDGILGCFDYVGVEIDSIDATPA